MFTNIRIATAMFVVVLGLAVSVSSAAAYTGEEHGTSGPSEAVSLNFTHIVWTYGH